MNLYINGSPREKNCYNILKDIINSNDEIISLANKDIKYCTGCNSCIKKLDNYCILNDYITNNIYPKLKETNKIIIASPLYMSSITSLTKTLIDRLYPFYNHTYLKNKTIYLILTGQGTKKDNIDEIKDIIKYFNGISEWLPCKFKFLDYFTSGSIKDIDNVTQDKDYINKINNIKDIINN